MQVVNQYNLMTLAYREIILMNSAENKSPNDQLSFLELLQSTLWAALGVQKQENRIRDFSRGNAWHFVFMGIGFTTFFVCLLIGIVRIVLSTG
jgi:hypothetical protein